MASEQALQRKILDYLDSKGFYTVKVISCNKRGVPDILACSPTGQFFAVEVKAQGKLSTVSPLQKHNLEQVSARDGIALATDNLDEVKNLVDKVLA